MITDVYNSYVKCARGIPGFIVGQKEDVPYDITELANGYCKAIDERNELKKSQYISALMVRYWHMVVYAWKKSEGLRVDIEDIAMWIYDAIAKAAEYRSWQDVTKYISQDPKGAEKVINQCITSVCINNRKLLKRNERKINHLTYSLNALLPGSDTKSPSTTLTYLDVISGEPDAYSTCDGIVQRYIDKGKVISAIILDNIMYFDSVIDTYYTTPGLKTNSEGVLVPVKEHHTEKKFSQSKLIETLKSMNKDKYTEYFKDVYMVDDTELSGAIDTILSMKKTALRARIHGLLTRMKRSPLEVNLCS